MKALNIILPGIIEDIRQNAAREQQNRQPATEYRTGSEPAHTYTHIYTNTYTRGKNMPRTNLFEYLAYLEQKVEQERAEKQKESIEKFESAMKEREKERQAFADLFAKAIKGQNNGK